MSYPIKSLSSRLALIAICSLPLSAFAQTLSNNTGGGDWSDPGTWSGGMIPTGAFEIVEGDTVTAGGTVNHSTGSSSTVYGSLIVDGGNIQTGRLNFNLISNGTVTLNSGRLSVSRVAHDSASRVTVNVNDGVFEVRDSIAVSNGITFNVSGGHFSFGGTSINNHSNNEGGAMLNLTGGKVTFENGFSGVNAINNGGSWNGGAVYLNKNQLQNEVRSPLTSDALFNAWQSNPQNVLGLSSKTEAQPFLVNREMSATQGFLEFNIYSSNANDNDLLSILNANSISLTSGVTIRINGVNLDGTIDDYRGQSYKLFDVASGDYDNIAATLDLSDMTIGGTLHEGIMWDASNLGIDGTISFIPEPSTYALMFGGLAIGLAIVRRRKTAA